MKLSAQVDGKDREIVLEPLNDQGQWRVVLDGVEKLVDARRIDGITWSLLIEGRAFLVDVEPGKDGDLVAEVHGVQVPVKLLDARRKLLAEAKARVAQLPAGPTTVRAPMPGKVVKVLVKDGDAVTAGQGVVVVEAMKMENELRAPRDAKVQKVHVREGQAVEAQETLLTLE